MRGPIVLLFSLLTCVAASGAAAQTRVELDRTVGRVGTRIVTMSDVRQARELALVNDVSSDASTQRCLVDRLLLLSEVARAAALPPISDTELSTRRASWEGRLGGASSASAQLARSGMSDSSLESWWRDDLKIEAYLRRQFRTLNDADRAQAKEDLLVRLRQRAGVN